MDVANRARIHAALGDPHRLGIIDALSLSDRTFNELAASIGLPGNAASHHLAVLQDAGLIERRVSEGDHRRRYISLRDDRLDRLMAVARGPRPRIVLFLCTQNSARSQFAAALWARRTGLGAESAGAKPAMQIHPGAVVEARRYHVELSAAVPKGYDAVTDTPDLVVSVCDRALEGGFPFDAPAIHWSVPDPVPAGTAGAFETAFADVARRIERLADQLVA